VLVVRYLLGDAAGGYRLGLVRLAGRVHGTEPKVSPFLAGSHCQYPSQRYRTYIGAPSIREKGLCDLMSGWTDDELDRIGAADELEIASYRPDGSLRRYTTIWVVRVGDDLYVRSWHGRAASWFRRALQRHEGRIEAGGVERDVTFEEPDGDLHPAIHQAYRTKYGRYPDSYVRPMVEPEATAATFRLIPR
jgi:hypothetical protein